MVVFIVLFIIILAVFDCLLMKGKAKWNEDEMRIVFDESGNEVDPLDDDYNFYKSIQLPSLDDDYCKYKEDM